MLRKEVFGGIFRYVFEPLPGKGPAYKKERLNEIFFLS
jgi:hypothetical protein